MDRTSNQSSENKKCEGVVTGRSLLRERTTGGEGVLNESVEGHIMRRREVQGRRKIYGKLNHLCCLARRCCICFDGHSELTYTFCFCTFLRDLVMFL
jgi:hypothetical protein